MDTLIKIQAYFGTPEGEQVVRYALCFGVVVFGILVKELGTGEAS